MKLGELINGYAKNGSFCCADPTCTNHTAEMWSRDLSGRCAGGEHGKCAHRAGGPHQGGRPVVGHGDGLVYVWHCGCDCHAGQLYGCGHCGAPAGDRCRSASGRPAKVHASRVRIYRVLTLYVGLTALAVWVTSDPGGFVALLRDSGSADAGGLGDDDVVDAGAGDSDDLG